MKNEKQLKTVVQIDIN